MRIAGVIIGAVLLSGCITFGEIDNKEKTLESSGSDSAAQRDTAETVSTDSPDASTHGPELETETVVSTDRPNADGSDSVEAGTEIEVESDTMSDSVDLGESDVPSTDSEMTVSTDACADDTRQDCAALGWMCGDGTDACGNPVVCAKCREDERCVDHVCAPCNSSAACGDGCLTCGARTPVCREGECVCETQSCGEGHYCDGSKCVENADFGAPCLNDSECASHNCGNGICCTEGKICCDETPQAQCGGFVCDTERFACEIDCGAGDAENDEQCLPAYRCDQGACVPKNAEGERCGRDGDCLSNHCSQETCCEEGECCVDSTDCGDVARPICAPDRFQCVGCDVLDACDDMYPFKPYCDRATGTCVECRSDDDCRAGTAFDSVIGICTKDGTCTCGVSEERGSCESEDDCPDETFCAMDASNTIAGDDFEHYVCLRSCAPPRDSIRGVSCEERPTRDDGTKWVWAPATSCFAFDRFGANCESSDGSLWPDTCRLSDMLKDGECAESDDLPGTYYCTYSCYDSVTAKGDDARCRAFVEGDSGTCGYPNEVCLVK